MNFKKNIHVYYMYQTTKTSQFLAKILSMNV